MQDGHAYYVVLEIHGVWAYIIIHSHGVDSKFSFKLRVDQVEILLHPCSIVPRTALGATFKMVTDPFLRQVQNTVSYLLDRCHILGDFLPSAPVWCEEKTLFHVALAVAPSGEVPEIMATCGCALPS